MTGLSQRAKAQSTRLKGLEFFSALMVMAGGIATLVTHNMVLAAAPLSCAVVLNLHNRRQMDRLTDYYAGLRLNKIRVFLHQDLQAIQANVSGHQRDGRESEVTQIRQYLADLSGELKRLETQKGDGAQTRPEWVEQIEILKEQGQDCRKSLTSLMQDLQEISTPRVERPSLAALKATLHHYQNAPLSIDRTQIAELVQTWSEQVQSMQTQLETLTFSVKQPMSPDISASQGDPLRNLHEQMATLNHQLVGMQTDFSERLLPFQKDQQRLQYSLHQLQEQTASLRFDLNSVKSSTLNPSLPQIQIEEQIETALIPLQVQYVSLVNDLDLFEVDIQGLVYQTRQLQQIYRQWLAIHYQVQGIAKMGQD
ncbi:hypothetical protein [Acaryochloris marina]|uniref:hypothetical protein n=1 Tax=Acaryochloris marina TaxID=155978 RepID=UPI001BB0100B|nr:hypothetical protein [Acaryochloris marina]QUY40446.1 hypothetical protein I1H34_13775 [Acaryochloris marina S15]